MKQPEVPISKGLPRQKLVVHCWNNSQHWKRHTIFSRGSEGSQRQAIQPIPLQGCLSVMQFWKQDDESESASHAAHLEKVGLASGALESFDPAVWDTYPKALLKKDSLSCSSCHSISWFLLRDIAFTFTAGYLDFMILLFGHLDFIDPCAMLFVCMVC